MAAGVLLAEGFDVRGCFLGSLKREDFTKAVRHFDPPSSGIKRLRVFVSHGKGDSFVPEGQSRDQAEAIRKAGVKEVRHEIHAGRGGLDAESLRKALDWFAGEP